MKELNKKIFNDDGLMIKYDLAIDWDGVIYKKGVCVEKTIDAMRLLQKAKVRMIISTARHTKKEHKEIETLMTMYDLKVKATNIKPLAKMYIDDRGHRFEGEWGSLLRLFLFDDQL